MGRRTTQTERGVRRWLSSEPQASSEHASSRSSSSADATSSRSRGSQGVDVVNGECLDEPLAGAEAIIDTATRPSPDQAKREGVFTASRRNLQQAGPAAGAKWIVVVSIIGVDKSQGGYKRAKVAQEQTLLEGLFPVRIDRAARSTSSSTSWSARRSRTASPYLPEMRTQPVALRIVAELSPTRPRSRASRTAGSSKSPAAGGTY